MWMVFPRDLTPEDRQESAGHDWGRADGLKLSPKSSPRMRHFKELRLFLGPRTGIWGGCLLYKTS